MSNSPKPITPSWPGNKRLLAPLIVERLPKHICYVEVFGGAVAVLLRKERSKSEVINDIDGDLVSFYRVVKYHTDELLLELRWVLYSRQEFQDYKAQRGLTDIQRAARWFLCNKMSFGGLGEHFGTRRTDSAPSRQNTLQRLDLLSDRLDRVTIERLDWRKLIKTYDAPDTCFFCDPPYTTGIQDAYTTRWTEEDHRALRDCLMSIQGKWLLTYDDSPLVRDLYAGCRLEEVTQKKGINAKAKGPMRQVIITPLQ